MSEIVYATNGDCPYCGASGSMSFDVVPQDNPGKTVRKCRVCDRHSTLRSNGKCYPHDAPADAESPCATKVRIEI